MTLQERQLALEEGRFKALQKLVDYKLTTLKNLLKTGKISKKEYLKKAKYLEAQLADGVRRIQPLIDPTIASTIQRFSNLIA